MPRPRLLFVSHCLPYPPDSGVTIRTYNVLRQLGQKFDVTVLAYSRRNHQPDARARAAARDALRGAGIEALEPVPIASEHSRMRRVGDHLRSVIAGRAYTYYQYRSERFRRQLREVLTRGKPELVHLDSIDVHGALDDLPGLPSACTHHDIESHALRRRAEHASSAVLRWYIGHQADLVARTERVLCPGFAANLVTSELDALRLRTIAPECSIALAPNGVDTAYFTPTSNGRPATGVVLFVGHTFFEPNRDAVEFFLADIWPRVRSRCRAASFHTIGRGSPTDRVRFAAHEGVTIHDYVPDVRPHFADADCVIVPIRFGGGTRIKILDAWAMGRAVVSTTVGCEGLSARDGENILVRDTPEDLADAVTEVIASPALREHLGCEGRRTVEQLYSWEIVGARIRELYSTLV